MNGTPEQSLGGPLAEPIAIIREERKEGPQPPRERPSQLIQLNVDYEPVEYDEYNANTHQDKKFVMI